jgi:MoaA/NifB/PqqE/SkfB family radical SAM enzyme
MSKYSHLKIFHFPDKLNTLAADMPVTAPLHVRLKPTNVCNHRCSYCAYRQPDLQLGQTMDVRDSLPVLKMREIVTDLVTLGVKAVTFSGGGDPFCYPHLLETAQALHAGGIQFASLTNGARLTGEVAEFFARHATWVRVSIDGWNPASYAAYRNVPETEFAKVMQNILHFQSLQGPCALSAVMNVDATNVPHVYDLLKQLAGMGVRSVKVAPIIKSNDGGECYAYHKPYVKTVAHQVRLAQSDFPQMEIGNNYKADFGSFQKAYTWCPALQIRPVIGADSKVYACQDRAYTQGGELFSIQEQSFREGWLRGDWRLKVNPARDCLNHCAMNPTNLLIHEYLDIEQEHLAYV